MKLFNWTNIRLLLMFVLVIFLFSFTSKRNENRKLKKSVILFVGNTEPFVKQETVNKLLIENNEGVSSIQKVNLELKKKKKKLRNYKLKMQKKIQSI